VKDNLEIKPVTELVYKSVNKSVTRPIIIAISGASGCGKTSLIKSLAKRYKCPHLFFDDYIDKETYPTNMEDWFHQGANVSLIKTPRFIEALINAKKHPLSTNYVFVEEPFGRQRDVISPLIDFVVLLDLPLELCLDRVVGRSINNNASKENKSQGVDLSSYMKKYNAYFKHIYADTVTQVRNNCDFVIDDTIDLHDTTEKTSQWLEDKCFAWNN